MPASEATHLAAVSASAPDAETGPHRSPRGNRRLKCEPLITAAVFLVYASLALAAYRPILPGSSSRMPACACGDPAFQTWLLGWIPFALLHGHNPFFSSWTNYPLGVNLAQNTDMPLLGLLALPVTLTLGPIASYNILLWVAFPLSAISMYWVCRRLTGSRLGAFIGGLIYGFSAYVVGQGVGHVMLSFVPIPPLFLYQLYRIAMREASNPYADGALLGLLAVAQFFISSEIMASMAVMGTIGLAIFLVTGRHMPREGLADIARSVASAGVLAVLFLAYPLWFVLRGPEHFAEPVRSVNNPYHGVGLGAVLPTLSQHFGIASLAKYGHMLDPVENGQYLGMPLVALLTLFLFWLRRNRTLLLVIAMAAIAYVLSLGTHLGWLHLGGSFPLPFTVFGKVPLLNNLIPERLSLYTALFVAVAVAIGTADVFRPSRAFRSERPSMLHTAQSHRLRLLKQGTTALLAVLALLALVPAWPYQSYPASIPSFFTSSQFKQIPRNAVVLTYPFPNYPLNQAMTWQSVAGMRFKEVGTYAFVRGSGGRATTSPPDLPPASVQHFLISQELPPGAFPPPTETAEDLARDVHRYVTDWSISAVIIDVSDPAVRNVARVLDLFTATFGPPRYVGGVALWVLRPAGIPFERMDLRP